MVFLSKLLKHFVDLRNEMSKLEDFLLASFQEVYKNFCRKVTKWKIELWTGRRKNAGILSVAEIIS